MTRKMSFLCLLTCLALLLSGRQAAAQVRRTIKGRVTDAAGNLPIAGVTVQAKGDVKATSTDGDGAYTLEVPAAGNPVLIFSYVGYSTREVKVGKTDVFNVALEGAGNSLNEVVVTGYTIEKKKDITGAVSVVNVADMVKQPSALITDQLQGQAAGVTVIGTGQPGVDPQIRIRGINTFGNNTPLGCRGGFDLRLARLQRGHHPDHPAGERQGQRTLRWVCRHTDP